MKFAALATVAMITATSVTAAEIGATGISIGAELDNNYNVDTEDFTITLTPEVGYAWNGFDFSASTDLSVLENDTVTFADEMPTLDFGVKYGIQLWMLDATLYGETGYDLELEDMADVEMGMKFSF